MELLPLFHRLQDQPVLVVGEGAAGDAKTRLVQEAGGIVLKQYETGVRLAFVALNDEAEAVSMAEGLRALGVLVNVVDRPDHSDFFVPAIVDRSPVVAAIGTGGASASLSKALKERLELSLPAGLGVLANAMRQARASVGAVHRDVPARRAFWANLLAPGGPLDPLVGHISPEQIIADALAGLPADRDRSDIIDIGPLGADALTLAQLRIMAQADLVVHAPGVPADVMALVRRDAERQVGEALPEDVSGRLVLIRKIA